MDKGIDRIVALENEVARLKHENEKLRASIEEYRSKESSISSAIISSIEHANQLEASRRKVYNLDIQRTRLLYLRMEQIIAELYRKYPELNKDPSLRDMSNKFKTLVYQDLSGDKVKDPTSLEPKQSFVDDPIKKLLHNIVNCFDSKKTSADIKIVEPTVEAMPPSSSGFDFNEALHPTMELDEILKSFNLQKKQNKTFTIWTLQ